MGKRYKRKNYKWSVIPSELKYMIQAEYLGTEHYCIRGIISWLKEHIYDCDSIITYEPIQEILIWVITAVEECLYPLELNDVPWDKYKEDLKEILERSEKLLMKIAPEDLDEGYRTDYEIEGDFSIIECRQRLNVFLSTLYTFTEEYDKLKVYLDRVLEDSCRNVKYLLGNTKALALATMDDWTDMHLPGAGKYETIAWIAKEFIFGYKPKYYIAESCAKYYLFLKEQEKIYENSEALDHLLAKAEQRLTMQCYYVLEDIDDCIEFDEMDESVFTKEKEFAESILENLDRGTLEKVVEPVNLKMDYMDIPF